ncbi:hypothetical protein SPRG_02841 [Saprolegnia parasitica CBS 223.65]|uniref:Methylated-DNA--protein-cysteine methyltransferase n=1 Tax=Saprolegnia parasitica (strain CBS 223.65) TaxID=695850 RepID=A0A067CNT8_SAPPC|nr:hypothetical protein SPRG_02841 [Saprolegnia parasitica CBS 223.65]KDO32364.1 hypothetical protein SPRG_02841 [Saprolegnia parasitica CBS 223.65]|eukprot:XP_012196818.1 hypothetical protein SPRG_02841 [Saprolegnia parasitica CBS 223.65]
MKGVVGSNKVLWRGKSVTLHDIRVYKLISRIPAGKVATYGSVAKAIQSGPRGVGQALRRNPFAPDVPCHRVVSATRCLHGFRGSLDPTCHDLQDKHALLVGEGVSIVDHKVDVGCMYMFTPDDVASLQDDAIDTCH